MIDFESLSEEAHRDISKAPDVQALEVLQAFYFGKKGILTEASRAISALPLEEKKKEGQRMHRARCAIQEALKKRKEFFELQALQVALNAEKVDVTLPGRKKAVGHLHPLTHIFSRVRDIFSWMGFQHAEGPEIETDHYNFSALNIGPHHPARGMQDSFYFEDKSLLRTQMSPVQIRFMEGHVPPFRMIALGKVYRKEWDLTHTPMFHQMEGLWIEQKVSFSSLKILLQTFLNQFFERVLVLRFRPSYFPFTEPSAEVDVACFYCQQKGCRICKQTGWIEVLGCGMVHPDILDRAAIDRSLYQGLAFGVGLDRLAMLYYGIDDLRALFDNDVRFLRQF